MINTDILALQGPFLMQSVGLSRSITDEGWMEIESCLRRPCCLTCLLICDDRISGHLITKGARSQSH